MSALDFNLSDMERADMIKILRKEQKTMEYVLLTSQNLHGLKLLANDHIARGGTFLGGITYLNHEVTGHLFTQAGLLPVEGEGNES
jgi:hypothetical protein